MKKCVALLWTNHLYHLWKAQRPSWKECKSWRIRKNCWLQDMTWLLYTLTESRQLWLCGQYHSIKKAKISVWWRYYWNEGLLKEGQLFFFRGMAASRLSMPQWMAPLSNAYEQHKLDLGWVVNWFKKKKTATTEGQELGKETEWSLLSGVSGRTYGWMDVVKMHCINICNF